MSSFDSTPEASADELRKRRARLEFLGNRIEWTAFLAELDTVLADLQMVVNDLDVRDEELLKARVKLNTLTGLRADGLKNMMASIDNRIRRLEQSHKRSLADLEESRKKMESSDV